MKFVFRWHMQHYAEPVTKPTRGLRNPSAQVSSVAEAADRFVRDQLSRKRAKTFKR
jgi:hypothetical protein